MTDIVISQDFRDWMRHDTWDACESHFRPDGWGMNPQLIAVLVRDGTPASLGYYSNVLALQFMLRFARGESLVTALSLGMHVDMETLRRVGWLALRPEDGHTRGWMTTGMMDLEITLHRECSHHLLRELRQLARVARGNEEGEEEEEEEQGGEEPHHLYAPRSEALRLLVPLARSLSRVDTSGSDLVEFVRTFTCLYAYPDQPHLFHARPVFMQVLEILIERGFPFDEPNERPFGFDTHNTCTQTAREILEMWMRDDLRQLFHEPCGLK